MPIFDKHPGFWGVKAPLWIAFIAALLYIQSITYGYVLDDAIVISDNVFTQKGIEGISGIWSHDTFYGFFQNEEKAHLVSGGRYRPFTLTLFAIESAIFGDKPWVGHLFNCLYYAGLCMLIYLILFKVLGKLKKGYTQIALWATLFFVTHPLHSEVVANIKGRDEMLAFLGSLIAAWILLKGDRLKHLMVAFLFFSLALFSKENAIVSLLLIPMLLFLIGRNTSSIRSLIPLGLATVLYIGVRTLVLGDTFSGQAPNELMNNPFMEWQGEKYVPLSYWEQLPTVFLGLAKYLQLFLWPWPLTHDYYPLQIPLVGYGNTLALTSFAIYAGATILALYYFFKKKSVPAFGWLWWGIALFPMSNLVVNVGTLLSERFTFIASLGLCILLAWMIFRWRRSSWSGKMLRMSIAITIIGVYVLLTMIRTPAWTSNFELFTTDVKVSTESAKVNNAAAGEYNARAGNTSNKLERDKWADKAIQHSEKAIRLHPTYKNAYLQLGNAHFYKREYEVAIQNYRQALKLDPDYPDALNNLGLAYREAGQFYGEKKQDFERALRYLKQAYELRPNDYETIRLLGIAHGYAGNADDAVRFFRKALRNKPQNSQAYYNLGVALMQTGKVDSGKYYIEQAKTMDPSAYEN